ncbi:4-diphosphocytidyl-2-C-methyl-D-erythritol kinase [Desulfonatronum thiosulfatophilum]|uniref:4-diphosphocytidyl-2-C-methyl-D-erythritol kinase n=1 Tax=Desulfonatronum thiosulfatophilum TaxID=617002 RepID=A0A1G6EDI5_9BACT|nr:4-(cytidine 5'-diphospho)-2-C-methyl-D-erythritol kinase [Desulfonatronum thiosulfatophilum]SDB55456.1 4-diphosphocytidyl-2-C-methyl-D-erythritol kinase [Desulfonatronum thiosulfatophilum]
MNTHNHLPVTLRPGCKVNIFLDILQLRADGYHDLLTIFLPLPTPHDILTIMSGRPGTGLQLQCSESLIPDSQNILFHCYRDFSDATGFAPDIEVHLDKNIPMGAGLGGGSSDAASFLLFLNNFAGNQGLEQSNLHHIASNLGADVPFFLTNQPAMATGRGDQLTPVQLPMQGLTMVLACPQISVSTAWAYKAWDDHQSRKSTPPFPLTPTVLPDNIPALSNFVFHNSFERPVFMEYPQLRIVKELLLGLGADGAALSGSGASIFAVFREQSAAANVLDQLRQMDVPTYQYTF